MNCKESKCVWYHRTNPFGNKSYCGFLGHKRIAWMDKNKDCKGMFISKIRGKNE